MAASRASNSWFYSLRNTPAHDLIHSSHQQEGDSRHTSRHSGLPQPHHLQTPQEDPRRQLNQQWNPSWQWLQEPFNHRLDERYKLPLRPEYDQLPTPATTPSQSPPSQTSASYLPNKLRYFPSPASWSHSPTSDHALILANLKSVDYAWHAFSFRQPYLAQHYRAADRNWFLIRMIDDVNEELAPDELPIGYPKWPFEYLADLAHDVNTVLDLLADGEVKVLRKRMARDLALSQPGMASEELVLSALVAKAAELVKTGRMKLACLRVLRESVMGRVAMMRLEQERKGLGCGCGCLWHED